jgi:hypothetical protein
MTSLRLPSADCGVIARCAASSCVLRPVSCVLCHATPHTLQGTDAAVGKASSKDVTSAAGGTVVTVQVGEVNVSAASRRAKKGEGASLEQLTSNGNTFGPAHGPKSDFEGRCVTVLSTAVAATVAAVADF